MKKYQKELEEMYVRTEHWVSDYAFFKDEFKFLINLVDKYFIGALLADKDKNLRLNELVDRLMKLDESRMHVETLIKEHLSYLARIMQNKELFDPEECRDRQSDLQSDQTIFLRKYQEIKKEIFELSEQLLKSARSKRLIS